MVSVSSYDLIQMQSHTHTHIIVYYTYMFDSLKNEDNVTTTEQPEHQTLCLSVVTLTYTMRFSDQRRDLTGDAEQTSQWPIGGFRFVMGVPP